MKAGDPVAYAFRGHWHLCQIVSWSGRDDDLMLLIALECFACRYRTFEPFPEAVLAAGQADSHGTVPLTREMAPRVKEQTDALLATRRGKELVTRGTVTVIEDARGKKRRRNEGYGAPPGKGTGCPDPAQEPLVLVEGRNSSLTGLMLRYLDRNSTARSRLIAAMTRYNPRAAEVFRRYVGSGDTLAQIGRDIGIAPSTARVYQHKAVTFARAFLADEATGSFTIGRDGSEET